ncbi:resolvase family integrase [Geobacillus thermoleovorans B23]|nr:resolvase family integrase [Geobacillus thermoleovorans B23]
MHGKPHQLKGKTFLVYKCKKHSKVRASKDWLENTVIEHANEFFNQIIHTQFAEVIEKIYKGETKGYIEAIKQIDRELKQLEESMVQRVEHALAKEEELQLNKSMLQMLKKYEQSLFVKSELESRIFEMNEKFKTIHDWKQESSLKMIDPDMEDDQKIELLQDIISRVRVSKEKIEIIFRHPLFTGLEGREEIGLI